MKFQNLCSTKSSSLCAFVRASSSSHFGAMKLGTIGVTTSLSSRSSRMTVCAVSFRPCIDIHKGKVKQIVGSTLRDSEQDGSILLTNFESDKSAAEYANLYKQDGLTGGHAIMLGADPLSIVAALEALHAYPGGLQVGGGINSENASSYIEEGASHVIVTSYVFNNGQMDLTRLKDLVRIVGKQRLVLDLSCRKKEGRYAIVTDRWQKFSDVFLEEEVLAFLADYADEFLVHGVDVEGKKLGIDEELVTLLGKYSPIPVTYAGGVTTMADLERIKDAGMGRVDVTVGSALDIFGGNMAYKDVVEWHARQKLIDGIRSVVRISGRKFASRGRRRWSSKLADSDHQMWWSKLADGDQSLARVGSRKSIDGVVGSGDRRWPTMVVGGGSRCWPIAATRGGVWKLADKLPKLN